MTYVISSVSLPKTKLKFLKTLTSETTAELNKINRDFSWLKYASRLKTGYRFLSHKQAQTQLIEKISAKIAKNRPSFYQGQIFDQLSRLINNTVKDELTSSQLKPTTPLDSLGKDYLNRQLIELLSHPIYLPLYPWFMPLYKISPHQWQTKDLATGKQLKIKKQLKNQQINYTIITN